MLVAIDIHSLEWIPDSKNTNFLFHFGRVETDSYYNQDKFKKLNY
jgi:hypothetical protein